MRVAAGECPSAAGQSVGVSTIKPVRILALTKYGSLAASTRQRFLQYEPYLQECGISVDHSPLMSNEYLRHLADGTRVSKADIANAYWTRLRSLLSAADYDLLWIQYELFPYLPAMFERIGLLWQKPLVLDFDDAIFHMYDNAPNALTRGLLGHKLKPLLRHSSLCCCGNRYLEAYARQYSSRTMILPTVVNTEFYQPASSASPQSPPVIGWIGSPSTAAYLQPLLPLLARLAGTGRARVKIVGAGRNAPAAAAGFECLDWAEEREITDIQGMNIGIMPLTDDQWARGKCGFKLIQYMACGLPVVASPVGANEEIVDHGVNGYLASTVDEWGTALSALISNHEDRVRLGNNGRARIVRDYSLATHADRVVGALHALSRGIGLASG